MSSFRGSFDEVHRLSGDGGEIQLGPRSRVADRRNVRDSAAPGGLRTASGRLYLAANYHIGKRVDIVAGTTADVDYAIPAGLHLRGVVVDDDGVPVAGAQVEVAPMARSDAYPEVVATTDGEGRFSARSCPHACLVGARAAGLRASPVRFLLGKDGNTGEVRLVLGSGGATVDGRVVTGELSGIGGRDHLPPFPALVRSDENGRFRAVGIAAGDQPVRARAPGRLPWEGRVRAGRGQTVPLRIELREGATIRGVVRDASGAPVASAEVEVGRWRDFLHARTVTAADGRFELDGLPGGEIEIRAGHRKLGKAATPVRTFPGRTSDCELALSRGLELIGRVLREDGEPVAKALLECVSEEDRRWFAFVRTDGAGEFVVANCPEIKLAELAFGARTSACR